MEPKNLKDSLEISGKSHAYISLKKAAEAYDAPNLERLPITLKILAENLLRHLDRPNVSKKDVQTLAEWLEHCHSDGEIFYHPSRVLMQDFTGVPAIVDLAAMRDAMIQMNQSPKLVNPICPVDLVIDHSVQVDHFGSSSAYQDNVNLEMIRNKERYEFLKWGQSSFENFRVVPPGMGICHQINLEYLGQVVWDKEGMLYPDTLVGTDSHTTMINGLGILGWGVGGIEAEAAMLGQPISLSIPDVVGVYLTHQLKPGITATDLVLTITALLRSHQVVGKFVEFFGPGLDHLTLADRATLANMAPEYGATCGFFPVDDETLNYLKLTGRTQHQCDVIEAYTKAQGLWHNPNIPHQNFSQVVSCDLASIEPTIAGPKRPQDRVTLSEVPALIDTLSPHPVEAHVEGTAYTLMHGDIMLAAITSCTNTSNPKVLITAGLIAKKAREKGLKAKPWVKCSLAPGSRVVKDYLERLNLLSALEDIGFYLVGYGCTTCIGNSGPLNPDIHQAIEAHDLYACAILSGNRNFEGRIHPLIKGNWLASPPLVVAYAMAGSMRIDLASDPIGEDQDGHPVYLDDLWPEESSIQEAMSHINQSTFLEEYKTIFDGDAAWQSLHPNQGDAYAWKEASTYIRQPSFFKDMRMKLPEKRNLQEGRILAIFGESVTTDHISPAGNIKAESPAGSYLQAHGVAVSQFNSYGARRGNHEVMMRGTFANIRIRNRITPDIEGGYTKFFPDGEVMSIYDAAMKYQKRDIPLVVFAGKEYGTGSSRDWAAKGTLLLGVSCVIAESFERIHRSNLVGMGVLPCELPPHQSIEDLKLIGDEKISITGIKEMSEPQAELRLSIHQNDGKTVTLQLKTRIDTKEELRYFENGGILQTVLRQMASN